MSLVLCKRRPTHCMNTATRYCGWIAGFTPSTSMKSGLSTKELFKNHVPIRAIMEGQIVALKKRLLQTELEADFDKLNWR